MKSSAVFIAFFSGFIVVRPLAVLSPSAVAPVHFSSWSFTPVRRIAILGLKKKLP